MKKTTKNSVLTQMSNEELWQLFPIILSEHNPVWKERYISEKFLLEQIAGDNIIRISHIGSTAVEGLLAKPTIDMLMEIKQETNLTQLIASMEQAGYIYSEQPGNPAPHMMFMKGYTPRGFQGQAFHLHVRYLGDWSEPYFCRYLQTHPETAARYGQLKQQLKENYKHDRNAYTNAKTEFIREITELARKEIILTGM